MQELNKKAVYKLFATVAFQLTAYWILHLTVPQYFWLWGAPLFFLYVLLNRVGDIVHRRSHWPKIMTGSEGLDRILDSVGILFGGASKEMFRSRHVAEHYNDIAAFNKIFSEIFQTFAATPPSYFMYPHKLLILFFDTERCRRENLSRQQIFIEMVGLYSYLSLMCYETLFCNSCYLLGYHLLPALVFGGSQYNGAILAHSGVDVRNSFDSCGLFNWREVKGLFKITLCIFDTLSDGTNSNHAIHHAYTQMPLDIVNAHMPEINAHCLKTYKNVRYNQVMATRIYKDLFERIPEPRWYDYIVQALIALLFVVAGVIIFLGIPLPPTPRFEHILIDYRILFYSTKQERATRWLKVMEEVLHIEDRAKLMKAPNMFTKIILGLLASVREDLKTLPKGEPVPKGLVDSICIPEVWDFNIGRPLGLPKKKTD